MSHKNTLFGTVFCQHFAYGIVIPVLILWQSQVGLSYLQIGLIQMIGLIILLLSELPSSYMADNIGKKKTMIMGFFFLVASFLILIEAKSFYPFLASNIFASLGTSFLSGTQEGMLHDMAPKESNFTKLIGKMSIVDEVSTILGMLTSSLVILILDIKTGFIIGTVSVFLGLIISMFLKDYEDFEENNTGFEFASELKKYLLPLIFFALIAYRAEIVFQSGFEITNLDISLLGFVYMFAKLFAIVGSHYAHKIEKCLEIKYAIMTTVIMQLVAFSLMFVLDSYFIVIALCIYFFSENVFRNIRDSFILKISPKNMKATFISGVSFSSAIFAIIAKPLIGIAIDEYIYYALAFVLIIKLVATLMLFSKKLSFG